MNLELRVAAPHADVYDALTTTEGLSRWWTTLVSGSATTGGEIRFRFAGLDEQIVMNVEEADGDRVSWRCLQHSGEPRWSGSRVVFDLAPVGAATSLRVRHEGVAPDLVETGWRHFMASLRDYLEASGGFPYGSPGGMP